MVEFVQDYWLVAVVTGGGLAWLGTVAGGCVVAAAAAWKPEAACTCLLWVRKLFVRA